MKLLLKIWPALLIFSVWLLFVSPYLLKGLVPYPSTYQVNHFPPWSSNQQFWGPVKNGAMPDIVDQIYPWKKFTIESLKAGQIPWWNPYNFSGNGHVGNFQSAVFSPFNALYFVLPFIDAWSLIIILQPLLAGVFTYLLMRSLRVSDVGSVVSSIAFMFSGFMVVWMPYGTLSMALCFLPLALYAIQKWYETRKMSFLPILSFSIALSLFSGHFQTSMYVLITVFSFLIYKAITVRRVRDGLWVGVAFVLGFFISLIQLIPSISLYEDSVRSSIFIKSGGIPFSYLITLVAGDFFGNPVTRNDWFGYYAEWASFVGILPVSLSLFSIYSGKKNIQFFWILAVIVLVLVIDSPVQSIIGSLKIPVLSTSNPSRIVALFSFAISILAGMGFDYFMQELKVKKWRSLIWPLVGVGMVIVGIWVYLFLLKPFSPENILIAKRNLLLPTGLYLGLITIGAMSFYYKRFFIFLVIFILLGTAFDSFRYAQKWVPFDPRSLVYPNLPIIAGIQKYIGSGRLLGNLGAEVASYYGFPMIDGYDPLYIERYGVFIQTARTGDKESAQRSVVGLDRLGKYADRVIDLLGVSLVFHPVADTNQGWAYPVWKDQKRFELVYSDNLFQLFKNNTALPRAMLFYTFEVIPDGDVILKRFYSQEFDYRTTLILEESPKIRSNPKGAGSATIVSYKPSMIEIRVHSDTPALLFLSDVYYKNWHATITQSGTSYATRIFRADYAFRAVEVPMGESIVTFKYEEF